MSDSRDKHSTPATAEAQYKDPERVVNGPLNYIMHAAYTKGIIAGLAATAFSFGVDRFFITPRAAPRWPTYAKILPQSRGYGWILFSLGMFQFFVEDTEIESILDKNRTLMAQSHQDELDFIANLEKKKAAQLIKNTAPIAPALPASVSKTTV
jgi:hypothetical protein